MPIKNKILIMINIFWAFSAQASESNVDPILANLWVNELDMNTDVTLNKQNNQFYIECSILKEKGNRYCTISNLTVETQILFYFRWTGSIAF